MERNNIDTVEMVLECDDDVVIQSEDALKSRVIIEHIGIKFTVGQAVRLFIDNQTE